MLYGGNPRFKARRTTSVNIRNQPSPGCCPCANYEVADWNPVSDSSCPCPMLSQHNETRQLQLYQNSPFFSCPIFDWVPDRMRPSNGFRPLLLPDPIWSMASTMQIAGR